MIQDLEKLLSEKRVIKADHPTFPLTIWNYSKETQYSKEWSPILLQTRGLVTDASGRLVAKSFNKFFNFEESEAAIPNEPFSIYEKMDGSLILYFNYEGEWVIASRGSFISTQVELAKTILNSQYSHVGFNPALVYVFELIGPSNRIVVSYPKDDLILIAITEKNTGLEFPLTEAPEGLNIVPLLGTGCITDESMGGLSILKREVNPEKEGYVLTFASGYRVKVKGKEYIRLHRIVTNLSEKTIWEALMTGSPLPLDAIPDEWYSWVKGLVEGMQEKAAQIRDTIKTEAKKHFGRSRKEAAMDIKKHPYAHLIFKLLDNREVTNSDIYKLIKP